MSEPRNLPRPRQVTTAAWMAIVASALLVISLFDTIARLQGQDSRGAVESFLAEPPGDTLAFTADQILEAARWVALFSGACAAAALVFAVFVLQRHRAARIGLTVAAGLLALTAPVSGILAFLVAASALLLWSQPGRDWYAGRAPAAAAAGRSAPGSASGSPSDRTSDRTSDAGPPAPWQGYYPPPSNPEQGGPAQGGPAQGGPAQGGQPPPAAAPYASGRTDAEPSGAGSGESAPQPQAWSPLVAAAPPSVRGARPATVTTAVVFTWIGCLLVAATMIGFLALLSFEPQQFVDEFDAAAAGSGVSLGRDQVLAAGWMLGALMLLWTVATLVVSVLVLRGNQIARILLTVSAVGAAGVSLLGILTLVAVVPLLLAVATVILLYSGGASAWFAGRPGAPPAHRRPAGPGPDRPGPW